MFGRNYINGSVKWIGVPDFLRNYDPPWTLNLLDPHANWGERGSSASTNWDSGSGEHYDGVSITWNRPTRVLPVYHQRIFENTPALRVAPVMITLWRTVLTAYTALPRVLTTPAVV